MLYNTLHNSYVGNLFVTSLGTTVLSLPLSSNVNNWLIMLSSGRGKTIWHSVPRYRLPVFMRIVHVDEAIALAFWVMQLL